MLDIQAVNMVTGNENRANTLNAMYINCALDSEQYPISFKCISLNILTKLQSTKLKLTAHQFILYGPLTYFYPVIQDGQCMYQCNIEACLRNHCCHGKTISIKYSECVSVALVIQHAKRMCRIILSSVASLTAPQSYTLSHKQNDFREKVLSIKCVF